MEEVYSSATSPRLKSSVFLLEVYAGKNSPLTDLAQRMNLKVIRFTREDGNWGRKKLWEWVDKYQPDNIWVAPECGAWGGWSRQNQSKSLDLLDSISNEQFMSNFVVNCAISRSRIIAIFHLDQPLGSRMVFLPEFQSILRQTLHAKFDMCALGLKLPKTSRFLKKRSQVFSTHEVLVHKLNECQCPRNHEHHLIEGSVTVDQQRMPVATYCSGFVRFVLKALCPEHEIFVNESEDEPPSKRSRFSDNPAKRLKRSSLDGKDSKSTEGGMSEPEMPDLPAQPSGPHQMRKDLEPSIPDPA